MYRKVKNYISIKYFGS